MQHHVDAHVLFLVMFRCVFVHASSHLPGVVAPCRNSGAARCVDVRVRCLGHPFGWQYDCSCRAALHAALRVCVQTDPGPSRLMRMSVRLSQSAHANAMHGRWLRFLMDCGCGAPAFSDFPAACNAPAGCGLGQSVRLLCALWWERTSQVASPDVALRHVMIGSVTTCERSRNMQGVVEEASDVTCNVSSRVRGVSLHWATCVSHMHLVVSRRARAWILGRLLSLLLRVLGGCSAWGLGWHTWRPVVVYVGPWWPVIMFCHVCSSWNVVPGWCRPSCCE